jgi:hypothetical protein
MLNDSIEEYAAIANDLRATVYNCVESLRERQHRLMEEADKHLVMWQIALLTGAWDVSSAAVMLVSSNELRSARILDRTLSEYGFRLHQYTRKRERAVEDGEQFSNFIRHIMRPTSELRADMTDAEFKAFRSFISSGSAESHILRSIP